jgi:hypothetical protein
MRTQKFDKVRRGCLEAMGRVAIDAVKDSIGLSDHTLNMLQNLGYPYARKHGSIQVHQNTPWRVHKNTGDLLNNLRGKILGSKKAQVFVIFFRYNKEEYFEYLITGTKKMLPRDVLYRPIADRKNIRKMRLAAVKAIGSGFRAQAGVRFL